MTVTRHADGAPVDVGALRFRCASLTLSRRVGSFVEIFGEPIRPDQIPLVTVTLGRLRVNAREVPEAKAWVRYDPDVTVLERLAARSHVALTLDSDLSARLEPTTFRSCA